MGFRLKEPLLAYRVADRRHPIFDGQGALRYGGRWTSPGASVVYASLSLAGAMLEILAHAAIGRFPKTHVWVELTIPKGVRVDEVSANDVRDWESDDLTVPRAIGDKWIRQGQSAVLLVPSVIAQVDRNIIINLAHKDAKRIRHSRQIPVHWDPRLRKIFGQSQFFTTADEIK